MTKQWITASKIANILGLPKNKIAGLYFHLERLGIKRRKNAEKVWVYLIDHNDIATIQSKIEKQESDKAISHTDDRKAYQTHELLKIIKRPQATINGWVRELGIEQINKGVYYLTNSEIDELKFLAQTRQTRIHADKSKQSAHNSFENENSSFVNILENQNATLRAENAALKAKVVSLESKLKEYENSPNTSDLQAQIKLKQLEIISKVF